MHRAAGPVCIDVVDALRNAEAERFATEHGIAICGDDPETLRLRFTQDFIELFDPGLDAGVHVDFVGGALAHRRRYGGGRGQAIARAIGLSKLGNPGVIDVTAGLARDAYVMACLGCRVTLVERSPVLHALVLDGLRRARASGEDHATDNFTDIILGDSLGYLGELAPGDRPDVIYMDPMYPARRKSAQVKKDMQILQRLIGAGEDEAELLNIALATAIHRVVVKRPSHASPVGGVEPTLQISSKKTRYDVYVVAAR